MGGGVGVGAVGGLPESEPQAERATAIAAAGMNGIRTVGLIMRIVLTI
jgi:hypothetical protein